MAFRNVLGDALLYAVIEDQYESAKTLLESNANPSWYTVNDGNGVLHHAIKNDNHSMIKLLLKHGANLTYQNKEKLTPIVYAAHLGNWRAVILIATLKPTDENDLAKYSDALILAARKGEWATVNILTKLQKTSSISFKDILIKCNSLFEKLEECDTSPIDVPNALAELMQYHTDALNLLAEAIERTIQSKKESSLANQDNRDLLKIVNRLRHNIASTLSYEDERKLNQLRENKVGHAEAVMTLYRQKKDLSAYLNRVRIFLTALQKNISITDWQRRDIFDQIKPGKPKHIRLIEAVLANEDIHTCEEEKIIKLYQETASILFSIGDNKRRLKETQAFYNEQKHSLQSMPFKIATIEAQHDAPPLTDTASISTKPSTTATLYPVFQRAPSPKTLTAVPAPQQVAPPSTAPLVLTEQTFTALMADLPAVPKSASVAQQGLYAQPKPVNVPGDQALQKQMLYS